MRIKVKSLSTVKEIGIGKRGISESAFRVKYIRVNTDSESLNSHKEDLDILRCLKGIIKDNGGTIDYSEISELVDTSNIIGNNFWNKDEFERRCRFEFRDYFDFSECEFKYV